MTEKRGRNDPCLCGSGKKFKKCCLARQTSTLGTDPEWQLIRQTEGEVIDKHLLPYAFSHLTSAQLQEAWEDFLMDFSFSPETEEALYEALFIPWLLFSWPCPFYPLNGYSIGDYYLQVKSYKLLPFQVRFIEAACKSYYSFYVVTDVVPGERLMLKDIFLKTDHIAKERRGTYYLTKGNVIFSYLMTLEGQTISLGIAPRAFSSKEHVELIDVAQELKKSSRRRALQVEDIKAFQDDLHFLCRQFIYQGENRVITFCNTDGEKLIFGKVSFKLGLPLEEAVYKLSPLLGDQTPQEVLAGAKYDEAGNLEYVDCAWQKAQKNKRKSWSSTLLGEISLWPGRLTIEVNSEERALKVKELIELHLQESVQYEGTSFKSLEDVQREKEEEESSPTNHHTTEDQEPLENNPAIQEVLTKMAADYWKEWLSTPLEALEGRTPKEAVASKKGREKVEALLLELEGRNAAHLSHSFNAPIAFLRSALKLQLA